MFCPWCANIFSSKPVLNQYYPVGAPFRIRASASSCEFCYLLLQSAGFNLGDQNQPAYIKWTRDGFVVGDGTAIVPIAHSTGEMSSPQGYGRRLDSRFRTRQLREWYRICSTDPSKRHDSCHEVNLWNAVRNDMSSDKLGILILVDVYDYRLVKFDPSDYLNRHIKYAALSYAQQGLQDPKINSSQLTYLRLMNGLANIPGRLANTYEDVFRIVKRVGLTYVWIDKLCLFTDAPYLQNGLSNMDRIYQGASLTIVAADGRPQEDIKVIHNEPRTRYYTARLPNGQDWAVTESVYNRLGASVYMSRGWTYQEIVLSHRLLIFVDGQAFFLCRNRMFSQDTWWDKFPTRSPIKNTPFWHGRIPDFIPKKTKDPISLYMESLAEYRSRNTDADTILNAFWGVLSYLIRMMKTDQIRGLPLSDFDIVLVWWHLPTINEGNTITRNARNPSWSWAGWLGGTPITFVPPGSPGGRNMWLKNHNPNINFWYKMPYTAFYRVWPHARAIRLTNYDQPGYGRPWFGSTPRPPAPPSTLYSEWALSFYAHMLPLNSAVVWFYPCGRGEILTRAGEVVGIVYADELIGNSIRSNLEFIVLCRSRHGDGTFTKGRLRTFNRPDGNGVSVFPKIRAKGLDLCWVMMVEWDSRGFYERKGLGFIRSDRLSRFAPLRTDWVFIH